MLGKWKSFGAEGSTTLKDEILAPVSSDSFSHSENNKKNNESRRIYLKIEINQIKCKALLDTGATISVLGANSNIFHENSAKYNKEKERLLTANGQVMNCAGKIRLPVTYNKQTVMMKMAIIPEVLEQIILGMNFFHAFNLKINLPLVDEIAVIERKINEDNNEIDLTAQQKELLSEVISKFKFSTENTVGCQTSIEHHIDTGDHKPICQRLYQYSPDMEQLIKCEIDRWLKLDYIEPANTDWRHPIVPVMKKNGKVRLCLDARKLNAITKRDTYLSPDLNHIFRRFPQAKLFFSVDLTDAFMQTKLTEESKEKTAFGIPGRGCFQYKRMPFGLKNSAATQSRVMNKILGVDMEPHVFHYLDDIVITANTFDELLCRINVVAERLTRNNLTVNPEKLEGPCSRIKFIGRIFDCDGQHPETAKVEAINKLPIPKTVKEVRSLVGTVTWYSHFVSNFSQLMSPITSLIKRKAQKVIWNEEADKAFTEIKKVLSSYPILRAPDYDKPFIIQCDASQYGIGAVLAQLDDMGKEYVISYYSHKLTKDEQKYHAYERECLAVLRALDHFKPYVYLQPFVILTDHHSLTQTLKYKGKSGRLLRWSLMLQPHAHQIFHRAGSQMIVADALSRAKVESQEIDDDDFHYFKINVVQNILLTDIEILNDEELANASQEVKKFDLLRKKVHDQPNANLSYRMEGCRLFKKVEQTISNNEDWKEVPHPSQRLRVIQWAHQEVLHGGVDKTIDKIAESYYWKGIYRAVARILRSCSECSQIKVPNYAARGLMPNFNIPNKVGKEIRIDFKGPFPQSTQYKYKYIVVVQEALSRFLIAECITRANVTSTIKFLQNKVLTVFPNIEVIRHDRGSQFMSEYFKQFLNERNIRSIPTASYAPHQNPVERANRSIGEGLTLYMLKHPENHSDWNKYVDIIIKKLNNRKHDATKLKPLLVAFGKEYDESSDPIDDERQRQVVSLAFENSKKSYEIRQTQYNKHARRREFNTGDIVMAKYRTLSSGAHNWMSKLAAKYYPVKIMRKLGHNVYEVIDVNNQIHTLDVRSLSDVVSELQDIWKDNFDESN